MASSYTFVLRRRLPLILGLAAVLAPMLFLVLINRPAQFVSQAVIEVGTDALTEQIIDQQSAYVEPERRVIQESDALTSRPVAEIAAAALDVDPESTEFENLFERVSAAPRAGTNYIEVQGTGATAESARQVTEAFTNGYVEYRRAVLRSDLEQLEQGLVDQRLEAEAELEELPETAVNDRERGVLVRRIDSAVRLAEAVRLRLAIEQAGVKVLSAPTTPDAPSNAIPPTVAAAAAVVGGLLLGLAAAFAYELFKDGVRTRREVENLAGAPVIATLSSPGQRRFGKRRQADSAARSLRLGLAETRGGRLPSRVLVVAVPGEEGQARVVADLLAASCVQAAQRVLVIADDPVGDAPPAISPATGASGLPLGGDLIIRESRRTGVWCSPATSRGGETGLFDIAVPGDALAAIEDHFGIVILVADASDGVEASAVHHLTDATVLACHLGRTSARVLRSFVGRLAHMSRAVDAVVLTGPGRSAHSQEVTGPPSSKEQTPSGTHPLVSAAPLSRQDAM